MTNEEILNIVKLKYPNAEFFGNKIILGKITRYFELPVVANGTEGKLLIENTIPIEKRVFDDGFHIFIEDNKLICSIYTDEQEYLGTIEFEFKNIIELKHLLNLEITRQNIVDFLEKDLCSKYVDADGVGGWELEWKEYNNLIVEEYNKDGNFKLMIYEEGEDNYNCNFTRIFIASNSNEYWRLYNIVNNLINK